MICNALFGGAKNWAISQTTMVVVREGMGRKEGKGQDMFFFAILTEKKIDSLDIRRTNLVTEG